MKVFTKHLIIICLWLIGSVLLVGEVHGQAPPAQCMACAAHTTESSCTGENPGVCLWSADGCVANTNQCEEYCWWTLNGDYINPPRCYLTNWECLNNKPDGALGCGEDPDTDPDSDGDGGPGDGGGSGDGDTDNDGGGSGPNGPESEPHEYDPPASYEVTERITNPLASGDLFTLINKLYNGVMMIVIPILVVALVYSGFVFVSSQGNEEKLKKAKRNATYIVIGIIIILAADIILAITKAFLQAFNQ